MGLNDTVIEVHGRKGDVPDGKGEVPNGKGDVPDGSGDVPDGSGEVPDGSGGVHGRKGEVHERGMSLLGWIAALALSLTFLSCPGFAQKADTTKAPKFTMKEIVVTATRSPEEVAKAPAAVGVVTSKELQERQPRTAAEALREETGITVQKTNHNGGGPGT